MQRRKATRKDFLSEFWMFFYAENDHRKNSKCSNQAYLWTSQGLKPPNNLSIIWSSARWKYRRRKGKKRKVFWWSCQLLSWQSSTCALTIVVYFNCALLELAKLLKCYQYSTSTLLLGTWCWIAGTWYVVLELWIAAVMLLVWLWLVHARFFTIALLYL